jgi:hypothetical protein
VLAQVEKLTSRVAVTVEVDVQRGLLGAGERAGEAAGPVQEVVDAGGKVRVVRDLWGNLGADVASVRHYSCVALPGTYGSRNRE